MRWARAGERRERGTGTLVHLTLRSYLQWCRCSRLKCTQGAAMEPTCQHISHDGVSEDWHVVDNVPEALKVSEEIVDGVGRRLQGDLYPGEKFRCQVERGEKNIHQWSNVEFDITFSLTWSKLRISPFGSMRLTICAVLSIESGAGAVTLVALWAHGRAYAPVLAWGWATWVTCSHTSGRIC